jgi:glycosyltransferase involved in cell wall biosynthesis
MTSTPELISVVIPVRNRVGVIGAQLAALAQQSTTRRFEVVVADNGSTDDTVAVAESFADRFDRLELVDASARRGASFARNLAAERARGEMLAFCDSDDIAHADWLESLAARWRPGAHVAGRIYPLRLAPEAPVCPDLPSGKPREPVRGFLPFADSANFAIGRDDLRRIGGFDEAFPHSHDVELSWRAQLAGLEFADAPEAVIFKRGAPQGWIRFRQYHRWGRTAPRLYRSYRDQGMTSRSPREVARSWVALGLHGARAPFDLRHRDLAVRQAGWYTGYILGSIRYRVLYF